MVRTQLKFAYSLSMVIAFLLTVASAGGLFIADFYRDNTLRNLAPLWAVFGVASLTATALLLKNLQSTKTRQRNLVI